MKITLNQVMPFPLASMQHGEHSIWGKHTELLPGNKVILNASSGKGKSTFINTVLGIRTDFAGSVTFDAADIKNLGTSDWTNIRQCKISAIFQDLQLFPSITVGQQQRLAIVRALCQPYEWLLMDEPFSHLDDDNTQRCLKLIVDRTEEQKSGFVLTSLGDYHGIQYDQTLML